MQNYAEKKGLIYKLFHPFSAEYQSGDMVFFRTLEIFLAPYLKILQRCVQIKKI